MENLVFHSTLSLADYKAQNGISSIKVIKNPNTEKTFWTDGTTSGAISSKVDYKQPLVISSVTGEEGDFLLLHNEATDNVVHVL